MGGAARTAARAASPATAVRAASPATAERAASPATAAGATCLATRSVGLTARASCLAAQRSLPAARAICLAATQGRKKGSHPSTSMADQGAMAVDGGHANSEAPVPHVAKGDEPNVERSTDTEVLRQFRPRGMFYAHVGSTKVVDGVPVIIDHGHQANDRGRTVCPPRGGDRSRTSGPERGSVARSCEGCDRHRPHHSPPPLPAKADPGIPPNRPRGRSGPQGPWPPSARGRRPSASSATGGSKSWLPPVRSRSP